MWFPGERSVGGGIQRSLPCTQEVLATRSVNLGGGQASVGHRRPQHRQGTGIRKVRRRLDPTIMVASQREHARSTHRPQVAGMPGQRRRVCRASDKRAMEVEADHATGAGDATDQRIRKIPRVRMDGPRIGV